MLTQDKYFEGDKLEVFIEFLSLTGVFWGFIFGAILKKITSSIFGRVIISILWFFLLFLPATSYQTINGHLY